MSGASSPGAYILEEMEARGWSLRDVAMRARLPEEFLADVIAGKQPIAPLTAVSLGIAFDVSPQLFLNLERAYRDKR